MNKKKAALFIALVVAILVAVAIWLFMKRVPAPGVEDPGPVCVVFQSNDPFAPCFSSSSVPRGQVTPGQPAGTSTASEPIVPIQATTTAGFPSRCSGEATTIDRNECVAVFAAETRQPEACDFVTGSLAKASCMNGVTQRSVEIPVPENSYQDFIESLTKPSVATATKPVSSVGIPDVPASAGKDPRFTLEGFVERATTGGELKVFALSHYQAKPGEEVTVYGSGFVYPSTVLAGSASNPGLRSPDGFSLVFKAPSATGEYEISVSNSKGTSGGQRPKLVVTDNPAPRPLITSASPSVVDVDGEVTLTGVGFMSSNVITTTLGAVENVSSNGTSLRFRIADLTMTPRAREMPEVKGKKMSVGVFVNNANGFNKDLFYFDVQF